MAVSGNGTDGQNADCGEGFEGSVLPRSLEARSECLLLYICILVNIAIET